MFIQANGNRLRVTVRSYVTLIAADFMALKHRLPKGNWLWLFSRVLSIPTGSEKAKKY